MTVYLKKFKNLSARLSGMPKDYIFINIVFLWFLGLYDLAWFLFILLKCVNMSKTFMFEVLKFKHSKFLT